MPWPRWRACARWQRCTSESMPCLRQKTCNRNSRPGQASGSIALRLHHEPAETERRKEVPIMDSMSEQAALAARASRGTHWRLNEKLSEGEIELPENIPIRMWIFTMQHVTQGHQGYEIVVWNRTRFVSIEMQ